MSLNTTPPSRVASGAMTFMAACLVAACSSSDGLPDAGAPVVVAPPATVLGTDVPVTATQTAPAVISFAKMVQTATSEQAEPLVLGDLTVFATDDVGEPSDV